MNCVYCLGNKFGKWIGGFGRFEEFAADFLSPCTGK